MVGLELYPCCRLNLHMLEFRCGWVGVVSVLQAEASYVGISVWLDWNGIRVAG